MTRWPQWTGVLVPHCIQRTIEAIDEKLPSWERIPAMQRAFYTLRKVVGMAFLMSEADVWAAAQEGWLVDLNDEGHWAITSIMPSALDARTKKEQEACDVEREAYVYRRADEGSELHKKAVATLAALTITGATRSRRR